MNQYANPPDRPTGTRHFDLSRRLVAQGYDVTIFAASFSHMTGRDERLTSGRLFQSARFEGVRFVWLRTFPYVGNSWRRQVNMLSFFAVFIVVQSRYRRPQTIVGSTVHPFAALAAWIVARSRGARFLFEIRDLWPQTLVDLGAIRAGSPGERLLRTLEAFLVRRAAVVVTLLPGMSDYLHGRRLNPRQLAYVPNGVDLAAFDEPAADLTHHPKAMRRALDVIAQLRQEGRFVLGYVGTFGRVNQIEVIIRAASIAERRSPGRVAVVLVGDGPERTRLDRLAAGEPNVVLCRAVPRTCVPRLLRSLDGTVLHATATPVYRYGISFNKLFEYMAAERPVIFGCESSYDPVRLSEAGISVRPDHPDAMAAAFLALADSAPEALARMGAAGRKYVTEKHNIERLAAALADLIEDAAPA